MLLPVEVPVMTLPNVTLFPQAMLPLYIFEPRYRKMLAHALETSRVLAVAMQKVGNSRETPSKVAGLGMIRAAVTNKNGTSHIVLQGLSRIKLGVATQYKPFRMHKVKPLETTGRDSVMVDALSAKVLDIVAERFENHQTKPVPLLADLNIKKSKSKKSNEGVSLDNIMKYLNKLENPDQLADLVSCALLRGANERQTILETTNLEARLKQLIQFLIDQEQSAEI